MALTIVKMAMASPVPRASASMAAAVEVQSRLKARIAKRRSWNNASSQVQPQAERLSSISSPTLPNSRRAAPDWPCSCSSNSTWKRISRVPGRRSGAEADFLNIALMVSIDDTSVKGLYAAENYLAVHDRGQRFDVLDLVHRAGEKIFRDDDHVRQLPGLDRSFELLFERK